MISTFVVLFLCKVCKQEYCKANKYWATFFHLYVSVHKKPGNPKFKIPAMISIGYDFIFPWKMLRMCLNYLGVTKPFLPLDLKQKKKIVLFELRKMAIIADDDDC